MKLSSLYDLFRNVHATFDERWTALSEAIQGERDRLEFGPPPTEYPTAPGMGEAQQSFDAGLLSGAQTIIESNIAKDDEQEPEWASLTERRMNRRFMQVFEKIDREKAESAKSVGNASASVGEQQPDPQDSQ